MPNTLAIRRATVLFLPRLVNNCNLQGLNPFALNVLNHFGTFTLKQHPDPNAGSLPEVTEVFKRWIYDMPTQSNPSTATGRSDASPAAAMPWRYGDHRQGYPGTSGNMSLSADHKTILSLASVLNPVQERGNHGNAV